MSQMTGDSANFDFGPCQVTFNAVDLGYVKGGVKVDYAVNYVDLTVDQSPLLVGNRVQSERIVVSVPMAETDLDTLAEVMKTGTKITDGGDPTKKQITFGGKQVSESDAKQLILTPLSDGGLTLETDANKKLTIFKAFPRVQYSKAYSLDDIKVVPVEFHGLMDSTKAAGAQLFAIGDVTAAA